MSNITKEEKPESVNNTEDNNGSDDEQEDDHEPYYEPIISLPEVPVITLEEEEEDLVKLRAKLYRFDKSEEPHQWKERGTGEIKILLHKENKTVRVLMRRDKTLKICANHYVRSWMKLEPNCDSDRAWVWSVSADFADEVPKSELLAVRFANSENAQKFKEAFEEAKKIAKENESNGTGREDEGRGQESETESEEDEEEEEVKPQEEGTQGDEKLTEQLGSLQVAETKNE